MDKGERRPCELDGKERLEIRQTIANVFIVNILPAVDQRYIFSGKTQGNGGGGMFVYIRACDGVRLNSMTIHNTSKPLLLA